MAIHVCIQYSFESVNTVVCLFSAAGLHAAVHPHPQSSSSRPPLMTSPLMFPQGQPPFNPGFPPGHPSQHPGPPPHMSRFPPPVQMPPGQQEGSSNGDVMTGEPEVMELDNDAEPSVRV